MPPRPVPPSHKRLTHKLCPRSYGRDVAAVSYVFVVQLIGRLGLASVVVKRLRENIVHLAFGLHLAYSHLAATSRLSTDPFVSALQALLFAGLLTCECVGVAHVRKGVIECRVG